MTKTFLKPVLAAGIALAAVSTPAAAQVNGMAVAEASVAVASSTALQTAFQQIGTQYAAQITQLEQLQQQRATLIQQLDTNGDGQLDEAEQSAATETNPTVQQITSVDQQINAAQAPIQLARLYVVNQVAQQYAPSVQQVISDRGIQVMLSPEAIVYAVDGLDVTGSVVEVLNTRVPTVTITPPADWQPTQTTVSLYQQVQQVFAMARAQQQQAAAAGQQQPATSGR